jgi:transposase
VGSRARLVITAITTQGLSQAEAARTYGLSQAWVSRLHGRYRVEGEAAFEPRSRRPKAASPRALPVEVRDLILRLRKKLGDAGLDAGPDTIAWPPSTTTGVVTSCSTISRHLARAGLVVVARG